MCCRTIPAWSFLCLILLAWPARAAEDPPRADKPSTFLRMRCDARRQPVALETALTSYVPVDGTREGLRVDLISALHVGEKSYFQGLNELFSEYDALLYELVAPKDVRPQPGKKRRSGGPLGFFQVGMSSMLELEFQLHEIDYTPDNFVHADLSPEEFAARMNDRGESFVQWYFKLMGQSLAMQNGNSSQSGEANLLLALFAEDRAVRLKRVMAKQLEGMEGLTLFAGPEGSTLITDRNKKALEVLSQQIEDGKKRIGIFYGAGHMLDMEERLVNQFKMQRSGERWLVAWDLVGRRPKRKLEKNRRENPGEVVP